MIPFISCRHKYLLLAAIIVLLLILSPLAALASPGSNLAEFSSADYSPVNPSSVVMQVIDSQFYKWYEYEGTTPGTISIYQIEPEKRPLTAAEAEALLQSSKEWELQSAAYLSKAATAPPDLAGYTANEIRIDLPQDITGIVVQDKLQRQGLTDNRSPISGSTPSSKPYYNIGFLTINFPSGSMRGTGFMISPYTVLTNGHNVYANNLGGWFKSIVFAPGQYETQWPNATQPFSTLKPVNAETNDPYLSYENNNDRDNSVKHDYAALFFDDTFSGITTFMPMQFNYTPAQVSVIGYPGVVNGTNTLGMWRSDGTLINLDAHCLYYSAYTSGGNSGSPVLVYNQEAETYRIVAIHSFAFAGDVVVSGGPHLNNKNKEMIEKWLRWVPESQSGAISSISLNKSTLAMEIGSMETLVATILPADALNQELTWASSNDEVAAVDSNGVVSALSRGSAVITVSTPDGTKEATCSVSVQLDQESLTLGDISGSGDIDVRDVVLLLQHVLEISLLDSEATLRADVNRDGDLNVLDVTLLMQFSLGIIDSF